MIINSKQLIRNFQLSILTDTKLEKPFSSIYEDLKYIFNNLNVYQNTTLLVKRKRIYKKSSRDIYFTVFYSNRKNDIESIWVNEGIIIKLQMKYGYIDYVDMREIITWYLKLYFKNVDDNQFFFSSERKLKGVNFKLIETNISI